MQAQYKPLIQPACLLCVVLRHSNRHIRLPVVMGVLVESDRFGSANLCRQPLLCEPGPATVSDKSDKKWPPLSAWP